MGFILFADEGSANHVKRLIPRRNNGIRDWAEEIMIKTSMSSWDFVPRPDQENEKRLIKAK